MEEKHKIVDYKGVEILRKEYVVLKNVDLCVRAGELVYLIGKVGAGKSSLLKTMYVEVPVASAGRAEVLGYDLTDIKRKQIPFLRRKIGIVFQDFRLLTDRNVHDNLEFVLKATGWKVKHEIEDRIIDVLRGVGMETKAYKMPHELSGGEQQRVVIARAMLNSPELLLADEPTGNLDPDSGESVMARLAEIALSGKAVIVATHNLSLIEKFPGRVIECVDKRLENDGEN